MKKIAKNDKIKKKKTFWKKSFPVFLSLHFSKSASQHFIPRFIQYINFLFCLKEHFKAQGMTLPVFLIRSLFGQYTASYMILLPFFDTFLSHWTCDSFFALKNGLFQKKDNVMPCVLRCSFQPKKINILNEPGPRSLGCQISCF